MTKVTAPTLRFSTGIACNLMRALTVPSKTMHHNYLSQGAIGVCVVESATEPLNDRVSVELVREIMDWARGDPALSQLADVSRTYLIGHSRVCSVLEMHLKCMSVQEYTRLYYQPMLA